MSQSYFKQIQKIMSDNPFEKVKEIVINKGASIGPSMSDMSLMSGIRLGPRQIINGLIPSKSNCYRIITFKSKDPNKHSHASLGKTDALKKYEESFFIQCNKYRNAGIDEYFELEVDVYYPNQRSDLDNSLKVLLDCLQKVNAIKNDNKCTRIIANKFLDKDKPRIEFTLKLSM